MTLVRSDGQRKRVFIRTYGCQMNVYDSDRMADVLRPLGYALALSPAEADLVLLTKIDLLRHLPHVHVEKIHDALARVMPEPRAIALSSLDDAGFSEWLAWLEARRAELQVPELA